MPTKGSFRVGRVVVYLRNRVWYLCYHERGTRVRTRVGRDRDAARRVAAETNAEIETGAPTALSFERVSVRELRDRWLRNHEEVRRSSVHTVRRYRAASEHLLRFVEATPAALDVSRFSLGHAEEFVAYLRRALVSPNGHERTQKRKLLDKGVLYIVETCRAMLSYAAKHRHLSPYSENPFAALDLGRIPVEDAKPIRLLTPDEERRFLAACDDWQFAVFATLMMTGLRPGELVHLVLPDDLDLDAGILHVTNKPELGWQVKTRNEREVPIAPVLAEVLATAIRGRTCGPAFVTRGRWSAVGSGTSITEALGKLVVEQEAALGRALDRTERARLAHRAWTVAGALTNERLRREFIRLARGIGADDLTAPKVLRHMFATSMQDTNVDPLIRMELMGHAPSGARGEGTLGMTAVYTHTRFETKARQLMGALEGRECTAVARERMAAVARAPQRPAARTTSERRAAGA